MPSASEIPSSDVRTVGLCELRWIVIAAQHRSLRQAAEILNVRQSTLSRRIRDLELQLGVVLFDRNSGGTRTTIAGQEFVEAARRILEETDSAITRVKNRARGESGRLTLGVYGAFSAGNLRATLIEYRRRFPDVEIHLTDGPRARLLGDLSNKVVDVLVTTTCSQDWDDKTLPLWSERVIVALPELHPLCAQPVIHWQDLAAERLVLPVRDPGPEFEALLALTIRSAHSFDILHQDAGLDRLLSLVGVGYGATLVLEGATGAAYAGVVYREVHDSDGPTRLTFVACWREANGNPTLEPFLNLLRERYPDLSEPSAPV